MSVQLSLFSSSFGQLPRPTTCLVAGKHVRLRELWTRLRAEYFPARPELDRYRLSWSNRRHTSCLASCNVELRRVLVAKAMALPDSAEHLEALLYHEMCHAALGFGKRRNGRRVLHGPEFKSLEARHPGVRRLNHWIRSGGWERAVQSARRLLSS
jgi:hypothetical protein